MKEKNNRVINMGFGVAFGLIAIFAYDIFIVKGTPIINHWLDAVTIISIIIVILILGFKYLIEEIL